MNMKKIAALTLAVAMMATSACAVDTTKDEEQISSIPGQFFEAFVNQDDDLLDSLVEGDDIREKLDIQIARTRFSEDSYNLILHAISLTEIENIEVLDIDRKEGTARVGVDLSYVNLEDFVMSLSDGGYPYYNYSCLLTYDGYIEKLDSFEKEDKSMNLNFSYNEDDETWELSKSSAKRLIKLFASRYNSLLIPVQIDPSEAEVIASMAFTELSGSADSTYIDFEPESLRTFDGLFTCGTGPESDAAAAQFVEAYITYVLDHDPEFSADGYDVAVSGSAPSMQQLSEQLTTREFMINYYMNFIRYTNLGLDLDQMLDAQGALIYSTLADAVADADPETYITHLTYDPYSPVPEFSLFDEGLIMTPDESMVHIQDDLVAVYTEAAIERLYAAGEMDTETYNDLIDSLSGGDEPITNPDHPNQAVNTHEEVPSFSDGDLVYAYSDPDENGFSMFYSKDEEYTDTVEYYIDDEGIWATVIFDQPFDVGTTLVYDWWVDDELVVDSQEIFIVTLGQLAVETYLDTDGFPEDHVYEMRIWNETHNHVYAYVILEK